MAETNQNDQNMQPGAVIGPTGSTLPAPQMPQTPPAVAPASFAPSMLNANIPQPANLPEPLQFNANESPAQSDQPTGEGSFSWEAAEFIAHHKTPKWFVIFGVVSLFIIVVVFFITKDITAVAALLVGAVAVGIYAGRVPQVQQYQVDNDGFTVGNKRYSYQQFKSFSVVHESQAGSIQFLPFKRFSLYSSIYYNPDQEDAILDFVENALPYVENGGDPVDRLLRRVRF